MSAPLPTAYLKAYPLPAFVVSVTAIGHGPGQSQSQAQRYAHSHRLSKRGSEESLLSVGSDDSIAVPFSKMDLDRGESLTPAPGNPDGNHTRSPDKPEYSGSSSSSGSSSQRSRKLRDGFNKPMSKSKDVSQSNSGSKTTDGGESLKETQRFGEEPNDRSDEILASREMADSVPPMPDFTQPKPPRLQIVWANEEWRKFASGVALSELVQPAQFALFAAWIEAQAEDVTDAVAHASAAFGLELLSGTGVGMTMDVIKTRHAGGSGLVIVTATRLEVSKHRAKMDLPLVIERLNVRSTGDLASPSKAIPTVVMTSNSTSSEAKEAATPAAGQGTLCTTLLEDIDWSKTSLGPREKWSPEFNLLIHMVLSSVAQDAVWIGPDLIMIYNQAYASLVDHPSAFGRPAKEVWSSIWDDLGLDAERALGGDQVYRGNRLILFATHKDAQPIESYHSYSLMPLLDAGKNVTALWISSRDNTDKTIAERRLETTRHLVEGVAWVRTRHEFFQTAINVLANNPIDAPFAAFYTEMSRPTLRHNDQNIELVRAGSIGIPNGHPHLPQKVLLTPAVRRAAAANFAESMMPTTAGQKLSGQSINSGSSAASSGDSFRSSNRSETGSLHTSSHPSRSSRGSKQSATYHGAESLASPFARAIESRQCVIIENSQELFSGLPVRQWDALPTTAIVIPLNLDSAAVAPPAVLLLGLNLYRPLDTEYEEWIQQVRGYLASGLSSVIALEEEIGHQAEKDKLERAKEAWFHGAANEFRTPLSLIAAPLDDILHSSKLEPVMRKQLAIAFRNTRKLQQLMNSLFYFTRLESGRVSARFMPVDLREFVTDIGAIFQSPIDNLTRVRFRVKAEEHDKVCVDPVLLEIVVSQLIVNALKYTEHGTITLSLKYTKNAALISVLDTGLGIPEAEFDSVTDVFHRSETVDNRGTGGTGMGLALVKEIVGIHHGTLTIKSQTLDGDNVLPRGSRFTASIPLSLEATVDFAITSFGVYARQIADEVAQWSAEPEGSSDTDTTDISGMTRSERNSVSSGFRDGLMFDKSDMLLIVDEDRDMLDFLHTLFDPFCTVLEAQTSTEAIAIATSTPPDLVIAELMLRPLRGTDLLAELREDPRMRHVPMVLLSSSTDDEDRVAALVAGADDFLAKPFKPRELLLRVHLHMQMGKKRSLLEKLFTEREQELVVLTDACPSGILRTDADGQVMYANDSFREPSGALPGEELSMWLDNCDEETQRRLAPVWLEILTGNEVKTNVQWKWKTGKTMSGVFIRLDMIRPGMSGIIACVTDISYQEEKLLDANTRRIEAEESKQQQELLVDLTSHEIRTPVSAILQCSSLVKENLVALKEQLRFTGEGGFKPTEKLLRDLEDDIEALESIYQCGLVQERIAGDVLALTRIQLDMLSVHDVEMDIRQEARKVLSVFSSEAKMKKIDISLELGDSLDTLGVSLIKTDPVRLGQVITNLTANAIRFTAASAKRTITVRYDVSLVAPQAEGGTIVCDSDSIPTPESPPSVLVDGSPKADALDLAASGTLPGAVKIPLPEDTPIYLLVSVTDTGPGMMPHEKDVLFQRFHQGNRMIHTKYGGSGLGLFICKKITELLGGQISVQSEVGVGSTFRFHIKSRTVASPLPQASISDIPEAIPPPKASEAQVMEPFHVLIVEDNAINQVALHRQLTKAGLRCDTANNGEEALVAVHEANRQSRYTEGTLAGYDVILMDLEMPVMDGLTAVRHIREAEEKGALRPQLVIALTGNARQAQIDQAIEAGMDDVVIKPYRLTALLAKLRDIVTTRRAAHQSDSLHN